MPESRGIIYTVVLLSIILLLTGCSTDKSGLEPMDINEYGLLLKYGCAQGTVRDDVTMNPLNHVLLIITSPYNRRTVSVTDDMGFYRFAVLQEGPCTILTARAGYRPEIIELFINSEQTVTTDIYLERGHISTGFGDITGRIFSSITETPIKGLLVTIQWLGISGSTNSEGEFRLYNIPEGEHVLQIFDNGKLVYAEDVQVWSDTVNPLGTIYLDL